MSSPGLLCSCCHLATGIKLQLRELEPGVVHFVLCKACRGEEYVGLASMARELERCALEVGNRLASDWPSRIEGRA